jgi:cytochrome oxidase Cu insertion factor (SCO1/SenC/PrrC family)
VLIQDLGFLGGLGTDPNSMIPFILLAASGYLAFSRVPAAADRPERTTYRPERAADRPERAAYRPERAGLGGLTAARGVMALGAVGLTALGVALMSLAEISPTADPILAESIAHSSGPLDYPAPGFTLTSQYGQPVMLSSLRGKVLLLTFLDPVCPAGGCPAIGQEFRQATQMLGGGTQVEMAGVVHSPADRSVRALQSFDRNQGLDRVPGWLYLTGSLTQLRRVWHEYGAASANEIYVIDQAGRVRQRYDAGTGPGTPATDSSFAALLADAARQAAGPPGRPAA